MAELTNEPGTRLFLQWRNAALSASPNSFGGRERKRTQTRNAVTLGELVVVAFDIAAQRSTDSREVSRLATEVVLDLVHRARRPQKTPGPPFSR